jgi:hypothetical protein
MKYVTLSALTAMMIGGAVQADALTLYTDPATGQVFTSAGEGRVALDLAEYRNAPGSMTIIDPKSPDFLLGKATHINMKFVADDNPEMWLKAGVRIQGTFENRQVDYNDAAEEDTEINDAYLRRVRFEVAAGFNKCASFVMDVRNDKANYEDKGEQEFNVGDAYVKISKPHGSSLVNYKLYRGKIDVSRTETVKSAFVIHYDRPHVADEAAQYITHNRRGTNAQVYGNWNKKVHYQLAIGDGVHSGKFKDASGSSFGGDLTQESFFYGGKVVLSPFDGWEETKRTETYFGKGKHFAVGASYWKSPEIAYDDGTVAQTIDHTLTNVEISGHYHGLFAQAEYFMFDGVVRDWTDSETGTSKGWYVTFEYVMENLGYAAPYFRYESWNKFEDEDGYDFTSTLVGVNWYLKGNSVKAGLTYQVDDYDDLIGDKTARSVKLTSQWFF